MNLHPAFRSEYRPLVRSPDEGDTWLESTSGNRRKWFDHIGKKDLARKLSGWCGLNGADPIDPGSRQAGALCLKRLQLVTE
jgi:hypothetical protein